MAFKLPKKPKVKKDEFAFFIDTKWKIFKNKPKAEKGEIVEWKGEKYKVESVSFVSHPEHLLDGERAKPNYYYQLFPLDPEGEEVGGWVNEYWIKKSNVLSKDIIRKHWLEEKPMIYQGKKYRIGKMSYGDYFLEPFDPKFPLGKGEKEPFGRGTLWLKKIKGTPDLYEVE